MPRVSLTYCEKAGGADSPQHSVTRPVSSTPRHTASFLFCPVSGILTLEPPLHPDNGEGAADPGRGLTADGDEGLLHLSFCSVPPPLSPCLLAIPVCLPHPAPLPSSVFGCVEQSLPQTPSSDPLLATPEHLEAGYCLQGFSKPPPNSLFSASHRPKGVGSQRTEAVLAFAQPPYCPPVCNTLGSSGPATLGRQVSSVFRSKQQKTGGVQAPQAQVHGSSTAGTLEDPQALVPRPRQPLHP